VRDLGAFGGKDGSCGEPAAVVRCPSPRGMEDLVTLIAPF
jgi:hypothetical protein